MKIDSDALIATFDAYDDSAQIDRNDLIQVISIHIEEISDEKTAKEFTLSYGLCPMHFRDIENCEDDRNEECEQIRSDWRNSEGIFSE